MESLTPHQRLHDQYVGEWLDVQDLSLLLNVSVRTLCRWRRDGLGPTHYKLGIAVRYRATDVADWLSASTLPKDAA
jgi:hypothetical protein